MEYEILHDIPGRLRVHCRGVRVNMANANAIGQVLGAQDGVISAVLSTRTGNLLIHYSRVMPRDHVLALLAVLEAADWEGFGLDLPMVRESLFDLTLTAIIKTAFVQAVKFLLLPAPLRYALIVLEALPYIGKGVAAAGNGRLDVAMLDAAALSILAARRDFGSMRTILWLFAASESLEEWTREASRRSLAESLALKVDVVWVSTPKGEVKRQLSDVGPGDLVVVSTGNVIPVDGVVDEGEALVNQSALTGESEAVHKCPGLSVFAGTVVDEGRLVVRVTKAADQSRLQDIIRFIEESENLKAGVQSKAERLADAIVPYSLGLALAVFALTRDPIRASAVLMVDYSCAIRMSTPLTILNAIQEGVKNGILVKGGKYLEALSTADSLVIDKTGTLTRSRPHVANVVAFGGWSRKQVLRTAACIEEHFPHPVGRAVVKQAEAENLRHRERHAKPEYILAHGIASRLEERDILVGSGHFIFDDKHIPLPPEVEEAARLEADKGRSLLYMAYDGEIAGMISIEDPIRDDAAATLGGLARAGITDITMLTGDGERTARAVADALGIPSYRANLLPVDKAELIRSMKREGKTVMFVGDGVNDSPALSAAHLGVSLKDGADIAKEVAGVVLVDGNLSGLVAARELAARTLRRVEWQFGFIVGLNSILIGLGLFGGITPRLAAMLHNLGTVLITANSIKRLLPEDEPAPALVLPPAEELLAAEADDDASRSGSA